MRKEPAEYVVGEFATPSQGRGLPQERKSPPLSSYLPERGRYVRLSPERYFDPARVDLEWGRLWTRVWLCAGRVSDLPSVGSFFRFDFGRESFIVSRAAESEIAAFYNVCQHRANRLVDEEFGHKSGFTCPYHSWRFDRTGKCIHVTDRELFRPEALEGGLDIPRVRCETHAGFVWINMSDSAPPLAEYLGQVTDVISPYAMEQMEVRADVMLELACNWKTILDAFSENYHVHITHASAMPSVEDKYGQMDFYPGGHSRRIVESGDSALRGGGPAGPLHPMQEAVLRGVGVDPEQFDGDSRSVRRAVQIAKRAMGGPVGEVYARLADNQLTDDWATNIFPNMHLSLHAEGALWMRYYPHRSDPSRCTLHAITLGNPGVPFPRYLPAPTEFDADGRPKRVRVRHDDPDVRERMGQLLFEDIRNTRETQLGLQSRGFRTVRLSEHEQPVQFEHAMIDHYLGEAPDAG